MNKGALCLILPIFLSFSTYAYCDDDPVAQMFKPAELSTMPAVYQSLVQPGSLLILREKGRTVSFEEASDMALTFLAPPKAATITLGQTQLSIAKEGSIFLKFLGYEPRASFTAGTQVSYKQAVFTGSVISGKQMKKLVRTDAETIENVKDWLFKGYHVYLVEGVFGTPTLDVVATRTDGGSIALGGEPKGCEAKAPALLPIPGVKSELKPGAGNQVGTSTETNDAKPSEESGSKKTTARSAATDPKDNDKKKDKSKDKDKDKDGTKESGGSALPIKVNAKLCHASGASYSLDSPTPVNIALKLQELLYYPDPTDGNKSIIDYQPVTVAF